MAVFCFFQSLRQLVQEVSKVYRLGVDAWRQFSGHGEPLRMGNDGATGMGGAGGRRGARMSTTQLLKQKHEARDARAAMSGPLVRRGIIRHLVLCFDMSQATMKLLTTRPGLEVMHAAIAKFLAEFFDINPLSHLMMVVTHGSARASRQNGAARRLSSKSTQGRGSRIRQAFHPFSDTRTCSYVLKGRPSTRPEKFCTLHRRYALLILLTYTR